MTAEEPGESAPDFPVNWRSSKNAVIGAGILQWLGFGLTGPFMPLYVQELVGASGASVAIWSGLSVAVSPIIASTIAPVWGSLADRVGTRRLAILTLFNAAGLAVLGALVRTPQELFLQRLGIGFLVTYGLLVAPMGSLASPREHVVSTMGQLQTSRIGSSAVGPALGGVLVDLFGLRRVYGISAAFFLVGAFLIWRYYHPVTKNVKPDLLAEAPVRYTALIRNPFVLVLAGLIMGAQFVPAGLRLMTPLYIDSLAGGIGSVGTTSGFIIASGTLAMALASLVSGQIHSTHRRALVVVGSPALAVIGCLALVVTPNVVGFAIAYMMVGATAGLVITLSLALGGLRSPDHVQGRVLSFLAASQVFSNGIASLVSGALGALDPRWVFVMGAGIMGALAALSHFKRALLSDTRLVDFSDTYHSARQPYEDKYSDG